MATSMNDTAAAESRRTICGLDLVERNSLDDEVAALVRGIEENAGFCRTSSGCMPATTRACVHS